MLGSKISLNRLAVTDRFVIDDNKIIKIGTTSNSGIECYILELLCTPEMQTVYKNQILLKNDKNIFDDIINKSILYKRRLFWRWERIPMRNDYLYPIDWDDTCKAIDALTSYQSINKRILPVKLPNRKLVYELLKKSIYRNAYAGEDFKIKCKNEDSLYMFISNIKEKKNNTEDIMVTAVTIRTILKYYKKKNDELQNLVYKLYNKIIEVAEKAIDDNVPYMYISRCYLSWGLFIKTIIDIENELKIYNERVNKIIIKYLKKEWYESILPAIIYKYLIDDERYYATIIAMKNKIDPSKYISDVSTRKINKIENPQLMYRHRRLGHFYGSQNWSLILGEYVKTINLLR
jgi:hypothetical protein